MPITATLTVICICAVRLKITLELNAFSLTQRRLFCQYKIQETRKYSSIGGEYIKRKKKYLREFSSKRREADVSVRVCVSNCEVGGEKQLKEEEEGVLPL